MYVFLKQIEPLGNHREDNGNIGKALEREFISKIFKKNFSIDSGLMQN